MNTQTRIEIFCGDVLQRGTRFLDVVISVSIPRPIKGTTNPQGSLGQSKIGRDSRENGF